VGHYLGRYLVILVLHNEEEEAETSGSLLGSFRRLSRNVDPLFISSVPWEKVETAHTDIHTG
jgi:hypothetical protein